MISKNKKMHSIRLSGIVKESCLKNLIIKVNDCPGKIKIHPFVPPIFGLVAKVDTLEPLFYMKKIGYLRKLLITFTRNPTLIFNNQWKYFSAQFEIETNLQNCDMKLIESSIEDRKVKYFINRDVARHGFITNSLDLSLDYELRRSFKKYELIISAAIENFLGLKVPSKKKTFFSHLNNTSKLANANSLSLIGKTFFLKFISELSLSNNSYYNSDMKIGNEVNGIAKTSPFEPLKDPNFKDFWTKKTIENAKILHGQVIYAEGAFWIPDKHSLPEWGEVTNLWPGLIRQNQDHSYSSPNKNTTQINSIEEAIYIGGTNNLMHFVIEDLPKLIISDKELVNSKIPIIVKSGLSLQIMETIRAITDHKIVEMQTYEICEVKVLHFYSFNNPLRRVMLGEIDFAKDLFNFNILEEARAKIFIPSKDNFNVPRIFIAREQGLFRPLINSSRVRKELESKYGFTTVLCGSLSLKEALSIFSGAEIVVAEYGAALANVILMKKPGKVVEIRGPLEKGALEYQTLIEVLGNKHHLFIGRLIRFSRFGIGRGPYKISVSKLSKLVGEILDAS